MVELVVRITMCLRDGSGCLTAKHAWLWQLNSTLQGQALVCVYWGEGLDSPPNMNIFPIVSPYIKSLERNTVLASGTHTPHRVAGRTRSLLPGLLLP